MTDQPTKQAPADNRTSNDGAAGWVLFAGVMILIAGVLNVIWGIAAVGDSAFFVGNVEFIMSDLDLWGWLAIIIGIVEIFAAMGIWAGSDAARWVGVIVAALSAIHQLLSIPAYPFWALCVFVIDVLVIYGLVVYGGRPIDDA